MRVLWAATDIQNLLSLSQLPKKDVSGVTFDSRTVKPGDLFIAFKGPMRDGYDFVKKALENGAAYCLVERPHPDSRTHLVKDSLNSLATLAKASRLRTSAQILGITGSFGKTTAKECAAYLLSSVGATTATEKSYNNHWGVPLSVANLFQEDAFGVFELGMNHTGELATLSPFVRPHVGLITTIGNAHQGNFNTVEEIVDAKCELFQSMEPRATAVLPYDNPYFNRMKHQASQHKLSLLTFGRSAEADVSLIDTFPRAEGMTVNFTIHQKKYSYNLNAYGEHLVETTLGVMAALYALHIPLEKVLPLMECFHLLPGRGQIRKIPLYPGTKSFITVVDESYNAGPTSMTESLKAFGRMPLAKGARRWAVLGDMLELGEGTEKAHQDLQFPLQAAGVHGTFLLGPAMKALHNILPPSMALGHYDDLITLAKDLRTYLQEGDAVFIKGSRGQRSFQGRLAIVIDYLENPVAFQEKVQSA